MELTITGEPHGDDACQDTKYQFQRRCDRKIDQRITIALLAVVTVAGQKPGSDLGNNARNENNKGVHYALNQRHGHHVAIGDMAYLMGNHRFRFIAAHVLQQPGADGHQRRIAACACGKRVNVRRVIYRHLRHSDTRLARLLRDGIHQPAFGGVTRLLDNFPAHSA